MNVITEYFAISGLNIPRYIEKLNTFRVLMNMPNGVLSAAPVCVVTRLRIRWIIPMKLIATPGPFLKVIGSLIAIAAMIIVQIGDIAVMMEHSIGVM